MNRRLTILGAGGHGKVCADLAAQLGHWEPICFLDDRWPELSTVHEWAVIGTVRDYTSPEISDGDFLVTIGDNLTRAALVSELCESEKCLITLISPFAAVSPLADISPACVVLPGAVVAAGARLDRGTIVNHGATVDHDCDIGRFVHIAPGAHVSGEVVVGDHTWIGTGASVRQCLSLGSDVVVGIGAAVVTNVESGLTVAGVPARPLEVAG